MKKCSVCAEEKEATTEFFYLDKRGSLDSRCKSCVKAAAQENYAKNRERKIATSAAWRRANPEKFVAYRAKYESAPGSAKKISDAKKKHAEIHADRIAERRRERERRRWLEDVNYRLAKVMAHQLRRGLAAGKANVAWEELAGYTVDVLRAHLEAQFDKSMSWENYGKEWHIDHITPVSSFDLLAGRDVVRQCWSLANLRPLAAGENRRKSAKHLFLL